MIRIILNFIIGIILIIGGLSGRLVYRGTHNSFLVVAIGIILIIYGIVLIVRKKEDEFEKELTAENINKGVEIKTNATPKTTDTTTLSTTLDDATKETIKGMYMEEAFGFVSEKYNISIKEAKKIVKEIKTNNQ
ncbi:MAG: hypothetical protein HXX16_06565 [Bacteroidales bacterium]|nr:hypothetical protein [Bacteroidales bacterium]